jgi:hypothetical protein
LDVVNLRDALVNLGHAFESNLASLSLGILDLLRQALLQPLDLVQRLSTRSFKAALLAAERVELSFQLRAAVIAFRRLREVDPGADSVLYVSAQVYTANGLF